jgi:hypothetical protein
MKTRRLVPASPRTSRLRRAIHFTFRTPKTHTNFRSLKSASFQRGSQDGRQGRETKPCRGVLITSSNIRALHSASPRERSAKFPFNTATIYVLPKLNKR